MEPYKYILERPGKDVMQYNFASNLLLDVLGPEHAPWGISGHIAFT